jgi:hypothetical protein
MFDAACETYMNATDCGFQQGFRMKKPMDKGLEQFLTSANSGLLSFFAGTRDVVDHGCVC